MDWPIQVFNMAFSTVMFSIPFQYTYSKQHRLVYERGRLQSRGGWTRSREPQRATKINYAKSVF